MKSIHVAFTAFALFLQGCYVSGVCLDKALCAKDEAQSAPIQPSTVSKTKSKAVYSEPLTGDCEASPFVGVWVNTFLQAEEISFGANCKFAGSVCAMKGDFLRSDTPDGKTEIDIHETRFDIKQKIKNCLKKGGHTCTYQMPKRHPEAPEKEELVLRCENSDGDQVLGTASYTRKLK